MIEQKNDYLAENLKTYRVKRGLTQEEFSKISGLARSTITNIESGEANPSLSKVISIAQALDISIDQLISKPRSQVMLLKETDITKVLRGDFIEISKLFPEETKGIAIDKVKIGAGQVFRGKAHLSGSKEYLTVIEGELEIIINGDSYTVEKNQVLAFPGDVNHSYKNTGSTDLVYISFVIPNHIS